jgi:hypothetical protein
MERKVALPSLPIASSADRSIRALIECEHVWDECKPSSCDTLTWYESLALIRPGSAAAVLLPWAAHARVRPISCDLADLPTRDWPSDPWRLTLRSDSQFVSPVPATRTCGCPWPN